MIILILIALAILFFYGPVALIKAIILVFAVIGFFGILAVGYEERRK